VRPLREWGVLAAALLVIAVGVEGIVRAALSLGAIFDTPTFLWGLTVIAAGTSLPDAFVSVNAARDDDSVTSLTNVLGSNTFNLLVAIPVGVLLAGSATINFLAAVPTMGFLALATLVFIVFARTRLELTDLEAYGFLGLYGVFLLWMTLESTGVIETVRGIRPTFCSGSRICSSPRAPATARRPELPPRPYREAATGQGTSRGVPYRTGRIEGGTLVGSCVVFYRWMQTRYGRSPIHRYARPYQAPSRLPVDTSCPLSRQISAPHCRTRRADGNRSSVRTSARIRSASSRTASFPAMRRTSRIPYPYASRLDPSFSRARRRLATSNTSRVVSSTSSSRSSVGSLTWITAGTFGGQGQNRSAPTPGGGPARH